ncbi:MAG: tetratricopeptide repeat protein, partial [Limisphaerales bacterium]
MTRQAALSLLALILSLGAPLQAPAQAPPSGTIEEGARREEAYQLLGDRLNQADRDVAAARIADAAKRYEEAYALAVRIGAKAEPERARAVAGVSSTRMQLATNAQKTGYLNEAVAHVDRVLRVDPLHQEAAKMKQELDRAIAQKRGLTPSADALGQLPEIHEKKIQVSTLVQDARVFLDAGELAKAEAKLKEALDADPANEPANYYMKQLLDAKMRLENKRRGILSRQGLLMIDEVWNKPLTREHLPAANPFATTNLVHTSKGRQVIKSKLERIKLDEVKFEELPLSEVVRYLKDESKARDPDKLGINFFINPYLDNVQAAAGFAIDPNTGAQIAV